MIIILQKDLKIKVEKIVRNLTRLGIFDTNATDEEADKSISQESDAITKAIVLRLFFFPFQRTLFLVPSPFSLARTSPLLPLSLDEPRLDRIFFERTLRERKGRDNGDYRERNRDIVIYTRARWIRFRFFNLHFSLRTYTTWSDVQRSRFYKTREDDIKE